MLERYELIAYYAADNVPVFRGYFRTINQIVKFSLKFDFSLIIFDCVDSVNQKKVNVKELASVFINSLEV